jgi:hypothetical protein
MSGEEVNSIPKQKSEEVVIRETEPITPKIIVLVDPFHNRVSTQ